ncbi:tRNA-uridine aminocarboxypropyltransferase [Thalassotalea sp. PLHSN55]|uniref:tRNA-uridine aminocarboxypropyltransferase n=1 Tax=Thalassotalea sp. PLHSN55 TaxID=3435888 RepID=UPI003F82D8E5
MHAVERLYRYRKSLSTTEFKARGQRVVRCEKCRVSINYCICDMAPQVESGVSFLLLMYDTEVLKPSNTGRLIADIVPDTHAYLWSRTEPNPDLLALLQDETYQPYVVFPKQYANEQQQVIEKHIPKSADKKPLFIMLDGSWREAKKMFRKSPYLAGFPIVSFDVEAMAESGIYSRYHLRKAANNNQLATAEVAARVLAMAGELTNADLLDHWFDVFSFQYQKSVCRENHGDQQAIANYLAFTEQHKISIKKAHCD